MAASGFVREYGDAVLASLRELSPARSEQEHFDDAVVTAAETMRPYVRQLDELVSSVARFGGRGFDELFSIYEGIGTMMFRSPDMNSWNHYDFDAYKIIAYEAFLRFIATLLKEKKFDLVAEAVKHPYLLRPDYRSGGSTDDFTEFCTYAESLSHRTQRLKLNRYDLQADLMEQSYKTGHPSFDEMMQADFLLLVKTMLSPDLRWYPRSLIYATDRLRPFELFARSESRSFFERWAPVILGVNSIADFKTALGQSTREVGSWFRRGLPVSYLANLEQLGTKE